MGFSSRSLFASHPRAAQIRRCRPGSRLWLPLDLLAALFVLALAGRVATSNEASAPQVVVTADFLQLDAESESVPASTATSARDRTPIRRNDQESNVLRARSASPATTLAVLGLILGIAYVVLLWLKRRDTGRHSTGPAIIDVLCSKRLDAQATLHLVRIGSKVLAVGRTASEMRTLAVVDDPEEISLLLANRNDEPKTKSIAPLNRPGNGRDFVKKLAGARRTLQREQHAAIGRNTEVIPGSPE